jgi:hypothetical protein
MSICDGFALSVGVLEENKNNENTYFLDGLKYGIICTCQMT